MLASCFQPPLSHQQEHVSRILASVDLAACFCFEHAISICPRCYDKFPFCLCLFGIALDSSFHSHQQQLDDDGTLCRRQGSVYDLDV
jgi:hypothetical protein